MRRRVALPAVVAAGLILAAGVPIATAQRGDVVFSQEQICVQRFQTGQEYLKNNRLHDAAVAFTEVKEACPDMVDAYLNLGYIQTQLGQYTEAIATYEEALDQDPGNLDVKESMAFALSSAGELDEALELYLELHKARPERPEIMKNLAFVYEKKGLVAEAVMLYNHLIEIGQADATMVSQAGRMALNNKLFFPAVTFYTKLYEFNPQDVGTLTILGGYYYQIRFYDQAIPYYEKTLELRPDHPQALIFRKILLDCYKRTKQCDKAMAIGEEVLQIESGAVENYCNLAFTYKDCKNFADAIETVRRGLEVDPNADCLYYAWGTALEAEAKALEGRKRYDEAIQSYAEAKAKFQRVVDLGGRYAPYARDQIINMDKYIERMELLKEREEMGN